MPNGYTYDSYVQAIATQIPTVPATDANFQTMLPNSIDYAELSLYRDLDFLALHGNVQMSTAGGSPFIALPSTVIVLEELYFANVIYMLDGHGNPILDGNGNPIIIAELPGAPVAPLSQAALRAIYSSTTNGPPVYFSVIGGATGNNWTPGMQILLGPTPDTIYPMIGYVTQRQAPLSESNQTTFISTELPDLFWAAAMIFWAGYLKNFGAQGYVDDPGMSTTWNKEYQRLLKSAAIEEARKKFQSQGWQAQLPAPVAAQPRK